MVKDKVCIDCNVKLTVENQYQSHWKSGNRICKECSNKRNQLWRNANLDKARAKTTRYSRKQGSRPFSKNKECGMFLGVHIAEQVISAVFKDVERMPINNPGYDVICNHKKLIDIKSSCIGTNYQRWCFRIKQNTIADYFLCLAFNNREDLTPLHAWLLPGNKFNHLVNATISPNTIHKWDEYRLDLTKILDCCDAMR